MDGTETRPFGLNLTPSDPLAPERPRPPIRAGRPITLTATAIAADGSYVYRSFTVWLRPSRSHQVPRRGRHVA